jgi:hypothetical protein
MDILKYQVDVLKHQVDVLKYQVDVLKHQVDVLKIGEITTALAEENPEGGFVLYVIETSTNQHIAVTITH